MSFIRGEKKERGGSLPFACPSELPPATYECDYILSADVANNPGNSEFVFLPLQRDGRRAGCAQWFVYALAFNVVFLDGGGDDDGVQGGKLAPLPMVPLRHCQSQQEN